MDIDEVQDVAEEEIFEQEEKKSTVRSRSRTRSRSRSRYCNELVLRKSSFFWNRVAICDCHSVLNFPRLSK